MNAKKQIRFYLAMTFSLVIILTIGVTQVVKANSFLPNGALQSGEVIDDDVFTNGQRVTIDGTVNGDAFILGNQVQITGTVNGSLFVIGQNVVIQGPVSGTTYVVAVSLELKPEAVLEHNLYFIGASLTTLPGSTIQRDLRTLCMGADLKGTVGRDTRATIGTLKIIELIVNALGGDFQMPLFSPRSGLSQSFGVGTNLLAIPLAFGLHASPAAQGIDTGALVSWLLDQLRNFGVLLLLGAVLYWFFRRPLYHTTKSLRARPLAGLGYGLLALLITFNVFLVCILVAVLIFVVGLWLGFLGLWFFAAAFWALAYAALLLFVAVLWVIVAYGTKLIVAYLVGSWLFEKILPRRTVPGYVSLAVGLFIYVLLASIPMVGWVLSILVISWGLGACWMGYRDYKAGSGVTSLPEEDEEMVGPTAETLEPEI